MATATGKTTAVYEVAYEIAEPGVFFARTTRVSLIEGYSAFGDIPKILATGRDVPVEKIKILHLALLSSITDSPKET